MDTRQVTSTRRRLSLLLLSAGLLGCGGPQQVSESPLAAQLVGPYKMVEELEYQEHVKRNDVLLPLQPDVLHRDTLSLRASGDYEWVHESVIFVDPANKVQRPRHRSERGKWRSLDKYVIELDAKEFSPPLDAETMREVGPTQMHILYGSGRPWLFHSEGHFWDVFRPE